MISDAYTVQFLLNGTVAATPTVVWSELANEALGFRTQVGGVEISITEIHTRPAVRISLTLTAGVEHFSIYTPLPDGWLCGRYSRPEDANLVERLKGLLHAAANQCTQRQARAHEHPEELRERLYRQLLFGPSAEVAREEFVKV